MTGVLSKFPNGDNDDRVFKSKNPRFDSGVT